MTILRTGFDPIVPQSDRLIALSWRQPFIGLPMKGFGCMGARVTTQRGLMLGAAICFYHVT